MKAGSLSVPVMRPNHCWSVLRVSILAVLLLTLNADNKGPECEVIIEVHRDTVYGAARGDDLTIECPVNFCNNSPPTVSWFKLENTYVPVNVSSDGHIKTKWTKSSNIKGISSLIFKNILSSDSGQYQCRSNNDVSHKINVSVSDKDNKDIGLDDVAHTNNTQRNDSNGTRSETTEDIWMYVYPAAGIAAFVIIVIIISVASMHGCKGKSKKETQTDNQYAVIPMVEQPFQASPRGSPSAPPARRSTRKKRPTSQPSEPPLPRDGEHLYGEIKEDRKRQRNGMEEEGGSVVYAALNHQPLARPVARPRRLVEETSEYAAIRVKDH